MTEPPTSVYGVDFAASTRDAGRDLWIAAGVPADGGLEITDLAPAMAVLDGAPTGRDATLAGLRDFIAAQEDAAFGLDFPFGVGSELVDTERWDEFVTCFPDSLVVDLDQSRARPAKQLYEAVKTEVGDPKRVGVRNDVDDVGLSPTDWRLKELTFYGVRDVLRPLVAGEGEDVDSPDAVDSTDDVDGADADANAHCRGPESDHVAVVPMESAESASVVVFESYPSEAFRELGANPSGYKGNGEARAAARRANVRALEAAGVEFAVDDLRTTARTNDDALDALGACYATHKHTADGLDFDHFPERFGDIYV